MRAVGIVALAVAGIAFLFAMPFIKLAYTRYFAPEYEEVRREVYEESLAYNRGKVEHLNRLCREMRLADDEGHRTVLAASIRTEAATYDANRLPADLRACVRDAK